MKLLSYIFLIFLMAFNVNAQEEKYPSKEADEYFKKNQRRNERRSRKQDKPISKLKVMRFKPEFGRVIKLKKFSAFADIDPPDSYQASRDIAIAAPTVNSTDILPDTDSIGGIYTDVIIKFGAKGERQAFIYEGPNFANLLYGGGKAIMLAVSENNGKSWKHYFTGFYQGQPIYFKWHSQIPLILDDNKFQVEAAYVRRIEERGIAYELVKDGFALVLDLAQLKLDSDKDGLTDIEEKRLMLNLQSVDTDKDGVPDNLDLNPRCHAPRTKLTSIYESLIDGMEADTVLIPFNSHRAKGSLTDKSKTYLIFSDNPDIISVEPRHTRVIIVNKEDYNKSNQGFGTDLDEISFSPMFKVDNQPETYKIFVYQGYGGISYIFTKKENGWKVDYDQIWEY